MNKFLLINWLLLLTTGVSGSMAGQITDIDICMTPQPEVRFTSDRTVYLESLHEGMWSGRYWNSNGRINWPFELWTQDVFQIEINGEPVSSNWQWVNAEELAKTGHGARHSVIELSNPTFSLTVKVHTLLDGTPVITRWLEITNASDQPIALTGISPWSSRFWANPGIKFTPEDLKDPFKIGYFTRDGWACDGWFEWKPISTGQKIEIESKRGYGYDEPFFIVQNRATGEHVICNLGWCTNWYAEFNCDQLEPERHPFGDILAAQSYLNFNIGPLADDALRVIAPGETTSSPKVHLGVVAGGLDAAVQAMHDHTRRFVIPKLDPDRLYRIQYLAPGDQGYMDEHGDLAKSALFANIDLAAAIGAELFILDCGWFKSRGHWIPSPQRFPDGLDPIVDYCREKDLLFGLWTEPERISENPVITEKHPDWLMPHGNLDLTKPSVAAYVESELQRQIDEYHLDLIRIAYDTHYTGEGAEYLRHGIAENNYWRFYEVFDDIYTRIHVNNPDLIMQNCSAGIGRGGIGMVGRFHEAYMTDGLWFPHILMIYSGRTLAFPPEIFNIAFGAVREQALGRPENFNTFLRCQFTLCLPQLFAGMVAPSLDKLSEEHLERFRHYAGIYKTFIRPLWPTAKVYHHEPVNRDSQVDTSPWFAMEFCTPDRSRGWATIVRMGQTQDNAYRFKPKGLDSGKTYRVTFDSTASTITIAGWQLIRDGLAIPLETRISSELLLFESK